MQRLSISSVLVFVACMLVLAGCGGGGSGGGAMPATTSDVAVLLTDSPTDEYESIFVGVVEISLIPSGGGDPVVLFASTPGKEIDILELRNQDLLLTVGRGIPSGNYDHVRIVINSARTDGGACDGADMTIPDSSIEVTPESPIALTPGTMFSLRLDFDADKSIVSGTSGNACTFQPVVFLQVAAGSISAECTENLAGTITELTKDETDIVVGFTLDLGADRGTVEVNLTDSTGFFDADGLATNAEILEVEESVTLRGALTDAGSLDAQVIVRGEIVKVAGNVQSVTDSANFVLDPDSGSAIVGPVAVTSADPTLILADCQPGSGEAIQSGAHVTAFGKISLAESELRAVIIEIEARHIQGSLVEATTVDGGTEIQVIPDGETDPVTILVPDGVAIRLAGDGEIPADVLEVVLDCGPRSVAIDFDPADPSTPTNVRVATEDLSGVLSGVATAASELVVGGQTVSVIPDAIIIDARGGEQKLVLLEDLVIGSHMRIFGLAACDTADVDFYGMVVLAVDVEITAPASPIEGSLVEATTVDGGTEIQVIPDGETDPVTILVPDGVAIRIAGDGEIPADVLEVVLDCGPRGVTIQFDPEDSSKPTDVRVATEELTGVLSGVATAASELVVGGQTVSVIPDAIIIDARGDEQQLVSLGDLVLGSHMRIFGLAACDIADVDFYGMVVLEIDVQVNPPPGNGDGDDDDDDDDDDNDDNDDDDNGDDDHGSGHGHGNGHDDHGNGNGNGHDHHDHDGDDDNDD